MIRLPRPYDTILLRNSFWIILPYTLVIHTSPITETLNDFYHWHIEIMPKLSKVAGFEWGTGFYINPVPAEESARWLREAMVPGSAEGSSKIEIQSDV